MAVAEPTIVSLELAEFVAKITLDAFTGIGNSLRLQEEQQEEMAASVSLDPAEFAQLTVSEEELDQELSRLFPSGDQNHRDAVYVGASYKPTLTTKDTESPPFQTLLGINLERTDYIQPRGSKSFFLAKTGVDKIRTAVHAQLGAQSQRILRSILGRGLPRVLVDSGRVSAKIALILQPATESPASGTIVVAREDARLLVRMVDDRAPQNQKLAVDILSELEIKFKTLT